MEKFTKEGKAITGSDVITQTFCELQDSNYWRVTQTVIQKRKVEGSEEWEEKTLKMSAEAKELEIALLNSFLSIETYLTPRNNDLFTEPVRESLPDKTDDGDYIN